jgi:hypothetical protein
MAQKWMYIDNQLSQCFIEGLETFLETTAEYKKPENVFNVHYRSCPCVDCCNEKKTRDIEEIREHLLVRGFMSGYTYWTERGEYKEVVGGDDDVDEPTIAGRSRIWQERTLMCEMMI